MYKQVPGEGGGEGGGVGGGAKLNHLVSEEIMLITGGSQCFHRVLFYSHSVVVLVSRTPSELDTDVLRQWFLNLLYST